MVVLVIAGLVAYALSSIVRGATAQAGFDGNGATKRPLPAQFKATVSSHFSLINWLFYQVNNLAYNLAHDLADHHTIRRSTSV